MLSEFLEEGHRITGEKTRKFYLLLPQSESKAHLPSGGCKGVHWHHTGHEKQECEVVGKAGVPFRLVRCSQQCMA